MKKPSLLPTLLLTALAATPVQAGELVIGAASELADCLGALSSAFLAADGKMVYESWTMYATGRIVLWSMDQRYDVRKGIRLLADPAIKVATIHGLDAYLGPTLVTSHMNPPAESVDVR